MLWIEILLQVKHAATETVADIFQSAGSGGVVIEDPRVLNAYLRAGIWDCTDLTEEEDKGWAVLKAYLPRDERLDRVLSSIEQELAQVESRSPGSIISSMIFRDMDEADWNSAWKQYFHPVRVGRSIVVKPTWEKYEEQEGDLVLELDPGMAFGTGTHHTTCLCLEKLEETVKSGQTVFDVGTGSGILAIAAAQLGAGKVLAIDLDGVAVKVAGENVALNGLDDLITVREGDLLSAVEGQADLIVANIIASVICDLLPDIPAKLAPGGVFIDGGIIAERLGEVRAAAQASGMAVESIDERANWALVSMRRAESYA